MKPWCSYSHLQVFPKPCVTPWLKDLQEWFGGWDWVGVRHQGRQTPDPISQSRSDWADHVVIACWLTMGVVVMIWSFSWTEDILSDAVLLEVIESGLLLALCPTPDFVVRCHEASNLWGSAATEANGEYGIPPKVEPHLLAALWATAC